MSPVLQHSANEPAHAEREPQTAVSHDSREARLAAALRRHLIIDDCGDEEVALLARTLLLLSASQTCETLRAALADPLVIAVLRSSESHDQNPLPNLDTDATPITQELQPAVSPDEDDPLLVNIAEISGLDDMKKISSLAFETNESDPMLLDIKQSTTVTTTS